MFIVLLGWLYVLLMVSITMPSLILGILTFVLGGLAPAALLLYVSGSKGRRARQRRQDAPSPDPGDTNRNGPDR
ncbi:hypothetical protein PTE30175_05026 [Pandoraea terrae]|uniref:Transmembrane protein n=1 Tax=Pandoraea terrae TaxID=1537710 RepID=A0A5E4Z7J4_9BURK|nr:hypothetical protein PTE30175_05026 [Pandoraea terrae]